MYQFNGWIVLSYDTYEIDDELQNEAIARFKKYIDSINIDNIALFRRNGLDSFMISGIHNHKQDYVLDIFKWVSKNLPGSYGLLYVWDYEDFYDSYDRYEYVDKNIDNSNKFIVWKIARGLVTQENDPFFHLVFQLLKMNMIHQEMIFNKNTNI